METTKSKLMQEMKSYAVELAEAIKSEPFSLDTRIRLDVLSAIRSLYDRLEHEQVLK